MTSQQSTYRAWLQQEQKVPVFFQAWWLDIVCGGSENWDVLLYWDKGGIELQGVFTYFSRKRKGVSGIDMPPLTPMMGPYLIYPANLTKRHSIYSFEQRVLSYFQEQIPSFRFFKQKWTWRIQNYLPFYQAHFKGTVNYTYLLSREHPLESIWDDFSNTVRSRVRNWEQEYEYGKTSELSSLYELQAQRLSMQGIQFPLARPVMNQLWEAIQAHQAGAIYEAKSKDSNEVEGAALLVWDHEEAYLLLTGFAKGGRSKVMPNLIWHILQDLAPEVKYFNFEGSMLPGVEQFFRSFGGQRQTYLKLSKLGVPFLNRWIQKL